ncbi:MAG: helix-turn-helix domain-containing protein [Polyangiaceae bacterium]
MRERPDVIISAVGSRIAELRRGRGWTQQELADRLGMEVQSLQRIERGENLTLRSLVKIGGVLGATTRSLLDAPTSVERRPGRPRKAKA